MTQADVSDLRQAQVAILFIIVFIISGFFILRWIHRANYNARVLGAKDMEFTPGWSIGYYFIPILALWKPYQAMKEIWHSSESQAEKYFNKSNGLLLIWWTLWITSNILGQIVVRISIYVEELSGVMNLNIVNQIFDFLGIPLALVFLVIVNKITKMQSRQLHMHGIST